MIRRFVSAAAAVVKVGNTERYLYRGAVLPADADEADVERLVAIGLVGESEVEEPAIEPDTGDGAPDGTATPAAGELDLANATVADLRDWAKANDVVLGDARTKEQIQAVITAYLDDDQN